MHTYPNTRLAVVEAKPDTAPLTEGVAQAKNYARKLQLQHHTAQLRLAGFESIRSGMQSVIHVFGALMASAR